MKMAILPKGLGAAGRLPSRSGFTAALWLCGLVTFPGFAGAAYARDWVAVWLLGLTTIIDLGTFALYVYHSIKNPNLVYSEDYLLRRDAISVYGSTSYTGADVAKIVMERESVPKHRASGESHGR